MIVVSDSSILIYLCALGHLDLLHALYGRVLIPTHVMAEILRGGPGSFAFHEVSTFTWIEVVTLSDAAAALSLTDVDLGEAEAIILAGQVGADLLLMDDFEGRELAAGRGLKVIGLLGVLIQAKSAGLLATIKPLIKRLIDEFEFRASAALVSRILQQAGE